MLKKFLRRLVWTIGILLVVILLVHAAAVVYTGWLLEGELAARREAGLPNYFQDLARPRLSTDENAAAEIEQAVPWAKGINQELYDVLTSPEYDQGKLSDASKNKIAALADVYERMCPPLRRAAKLEHYQSLILVELPSRAENISLDRVLEKASESRSISRALRLRAMQLAADDRQDEAVEILALMLAISRQLANEPTITGYLVSLGCKRDATETLASMIASQPLTEEQRRLLDEELTRHDDLTLVKVALQGETAYSMSMLADMSPRWIARPIVQAWQYNHLKYMSALGEAIEGDDMNVDMPPVPTGQGYVSQLLNFWVSLASKAFDSMRRSALNDVARTRCLRTMIALQAHLQEHPESMPTIDKLGLPSEAVRDPFSQEALRLKHTEAGWLIYSVGDDGIDDLGTFDKDADVGYLLPSRAAE